jgi:hypothetical protein
VTIAAGCGARVHALGTVELRATVALVLYGPRYVRAPTDRSGRRHRPGELVCMDRHRI